MNRLVPAALLLAALSLAGCAGYSSYPPVEASYGESKGANSPAAEGAMITALQYAVTRYPPDGPRQDASSSAEASSLRADFPLVVNLPLGTRKSVYEHVAAKLGPQAMPMTPESEASGNPIYSVTRVWVRQSAATVDILRPMPELPPGPDGKPVYQTITCNLEGGFRPWRVTYARVWSPTGADHPIAFYLPDVDRHDEFKRAMAEKKAAEGATRNTTAPEQPTENATAPE